MNTTLTSPQPRARWMRLDTAQILKRFYFCERSLIVSCSAWLPHLGPVEQKTLLPLYSWQNSMTANELRDRVFELKYPSRAMAEEGADKPLVDLFNELQNAPSTHAFFLALASVLLPAVRDAYEEFLKHSDPLADAPTHRFLTLALNEKEAQIAAMQAWAEEELASHPEDAAIALSWTANMSERLTSLGGVGTDHAPADLAAAAIPGSRPYSLPSQPARDKRYLPIRFYWPDNIDPTYPYGEGLRLQLRSAVSHLNEVWAVETGGIILSSFAPTLPWEWIFDAARWTYDEARHCRMGYDRLTAWGFAPSEIPLGTYIYDSATGEDPIYRLGMLFFFETKNIGRKPERIKAFQGIGDDASEHDMDFDWADETIHAGYGKKWLQQLLEIRGQDPSSYDQIRDRCSQLVAAEVAKATPQEVEQLRAVTDAIIAKAERRAQTLAAA